MKPFREGRSTNATYDSLTVALTGRLSTVLLLAPALALLASLGLLKLYRRSVLRSMGARGGAPLTGRSEVPPAPGQPAEGGPAAVVLEEGYEREPANGAPGEVLYAEAMRDPWRAAAIYAAAGSCYSIVMATAFLAATGFGFLPFRAFFLFWLYFWPAVVTVNLVAARI